MESTFKESYVIPGRLVFMLSGGWYSVVQGYFLFSPDEVMCSAQVFDRGGTQALI